MKCPIEKRIINGGQGPPVSVTAANGQVLIFKNPGGLIKIIEISMQPESDAHLQIMEGGAAGLNSGIPMTAVRFVQQYLLWSTPGKPTNSDLYLTIQEPNVLVDVDVRYTVE